MDCRFLHTRHIPEEHLRTETPFGRRVVENGLCDVIRPERLRELRENGVSVIEERLTWHELEPKPGTYDWSRFDRDARRILDSGMKLAVFPWFQHPPVWEQDLVHLKSLNTGVEASVPSLWDGRLLEVYDRLYEALKNHCGDAISHLQCCCYGDYGEVQYIFGVRHYRSLAPNASFGLWSADALARQDFANHLRRKYQDSLDMLNQAWKTDFRSWTDDFMPRLPFDANALPRRVDYALWYNESLMRFTDRALAIARRHFPTVSAGIPIGSTTEPLEFGQIKSLSAKVAAKYGITARWTAICRYGDDVLRSMIFDRRVSTAAQFYGTTFSVEASLEMPNHLPSLFEYEVNGGHIFHIDPKDYREGTDTFKREFPLVQEHLRFSTPIALFYPIEGELAQCLTSPNDREPERDDFGDFNGTQRRQPIEDYYDQAVELGKQTDYGVVDSYMIDDGALDAFPFLAILASVPVPRRIIPALARWMKNGGSLLLQKDQRPWILEDQQPLAEALDQCGEKPSWLEDWNGRPDQIKLREKYGPNAIICNHSAGVTVYNPVVPQIIRLKNNGE